MAINIEEAVARVIQSEDFLVPFMVGGFIVLLVLINVTGKTIRSNSRERTRREIAAYIAEGSMTPEQGERLMKAGERRES